MDEKKRNRCMDRLEEIDRRIANLSAEYADKREAKHMRLNHEREILLREFPEIRFDGMPLGF